MRVTGTVQGVGFRPYVFRLATGLGLGGWVLNDERGVEMELEGSAEGVEELLARLPAEAPPLAVVEGIETFPAQALGDTVFRIVGSRRHGGPGAPVAADHATCAECLGELFDPADRRHRYPFINCTNCGPRFTIVRAVPYDRGLTTMAGFEMCPRCRAEFDDPGNRRFHAEPNACPACGPGVWLADSEGAELPEARADPVAAAARMLAAGRILAVKGIGGFHLACRADDEGAVAELRSRKHREEKPLALMAADLAAARELVQLQPEEEALLEGPERPILIARRRPGTAVAESVAPGSPDLGVMLPYSPLHHLLLADVATALVMTSGNLSDEPIAYRNLDALERLDGLADAFLLSDRPIHMRTDDSVVRGVSPRLRAAPLLLRRSRGYVPRAVELPVACGREVLGCGAELKNTFCLAKGGRAWVSQHIGDLSNWETLTSFRNGVEHFERLFAVSPEVVAHDLHPDYLATRYALDREGVERLAVQHHHAHLAACLAEHGEPGPAVGAIFDGAGYGPDGTVWGGEVLVGDLAEFDRSAALFGVALPGGDAAAREPWRMACAWLTAALDEPRPALPAPLRTEVAMADWEAVCGLVASGVNAPLTSSAGRLFDAAAAICGIRARVSHEGQAASELEAIADRGHADAYPLAVRDGTGEEAPTILDARETVTALADDVARGTETSIVAARFHNALADAAVAGMANEAGRRGIEVAALSGGVFQNRLLLERAALGLRDRGLRVLLPERLPPNDGGIAYGQVAVAAARAGRG